MKMNRSSIEAVIMVALREGTELGAAEAGSRLAHFRKASDKILAGL